MWWTIEKRELDIKVRKCWIGREKKREENFKNKVSEENDMLDGKSGRHKLPT